MDPQVSWEEMLEAIAGGQLGDAEVRAEALLDWTHKDGFPPQTTTRLLPREWDRVVCQYLCRKVQDAAKAPWE